MVGEALLWRNVAEFCETDRYTRPRQQRAMSILCTPTCMFVIPQNETELAKAMGQALWGKP